MEMEQIIYADRVRMIKDATQVQLSELKELKGLISDEDLSFYEDAVLYTLQKQMLELKCMQGTLTDAEFDDMCA